MVDGARRLETYLAELRSGLRGLPEGEVAEIAAELGSHVRDAAGGDLSEGAVAAVLERLGRPAELASLYVTESLLARAASGGSPWLLARGLLRWATVSIAGGLALAGLLIGWLVAACFVCAALIKPFAPHRVGLWRLSGDEVSLRLGLVAPPPQQGEELLGWWIVPLGLALGALALWLTPRFGRWAIRRFGRTPILPAR